jgi:hypothetical protein
MPKISTHERSVKLVIDFLVQDLRATCKEISQTTGISTTSVFRILTKDLQKRQFCARWLPHYLTAEQKQKRLEIYRNKDLTLKGKLSCIKLSLLTKRGLESLNWI